MGMAWGALPPPLVLWRGGTGGPAAFGVRGSQSGIPPPPGSRGGEGRCLRGPSEGEGVGGGGGVRGQKGSGEETEEGGKKAWLSSPRMRPCGGGWRCSGELKTSGVLTGSRGGRVDGPPLVENANPS